MFVSLQDNCFKIPDNISHFKMEKQPNTLMCKLSLLKIKSFAIKPLIGLVSKSLNVILLSCSLSIVERRSSVTIP